MTRRPHSFTDDRGRDVPYPDLADLDAERRSIEGLGALLTRINPTNPGVLRPLSGGQIVWIVGAGLLWLLVYALALRQPLHVRIFVTTMAMVIIFTVAQAYRRTWLPKGARDLRRVLLTASLCPSCTHSLEGLPRHEDGCVVCPECGAAWNWTPRAAAR